MKKYKIRFFFHKLFFPKYHQALQRAIEISRVYMHESPDPIKREVGEDIFWKITDRLKM